MPLPIGFDMDGVLADFDLAFHEVEVRLFGPSATTRAGDPENEAVEAPSADIDAAAPADPPVEDKSPRLAKKEAREVDSDFTSTQFVGLSSTWKSSFMAPAAAPGRS
jgi:hypothetical protein